MIFEELIDTNKLIDVVFYPRKFFKPTETETLKVVEFEVKDEYWNKKVKVAGIFHIKDKNLPTLLFFHGNAETADDYNDSAQNFFDLGVNFLIMDYRGYGLSSGYPTLRNLVFDPPQIYRLVKDYLKNNGFNPGIFVMGRSLGSIAIGEIANQYPDEPLGFVFESGAADIFRLMRNLFLQDISKEEESRFPEYTNIHKIQKIKKPTLILHGQKDELIPPDQAKLIFILLSDFIDKKLVLIPLATHNNISSFYEEYYGSLGEFIKEYSK